ncbi:MAG: AsmA family protein [Gammaproteobacteria bacterium]|nr:AsmA family protein [Gammaproteobacteria bacterium]
MKLLAKILAGVAALALLVAIALGVAVTLLFDPEEYRPLLAESVQRTTGRQFTLDGELGLDVFPCCSVTLGRAALGNPPGFPPEDFARVESAALSIRLWPLVTRGEVAIGTVRLQGLDARLMVREDGAANWEFEGEADAAAPTPAAAGDGETRLQVERIEVRDGRVAYRDATDGSAYHAEALRLDTGRIEPGEPFELALDTRLTDETDGTTGTLALRGQASLDATFERLTLAKPVFNITAAGGAVPGKDATLKLVATTLEVVLAEATRFDFRGVEGEFALSGLEAVPGDAQGRFTAAEAGLESGASTELTLPALAAEVSLTGPDMPGGPIEAALKFTGVALDVDKLHGSIEGLAADVTGLGARLMLTGGGRLAAAGAALDGTLKLEPVSPRSLLAVLGEPPPRTADPKVLTRLAGTARWALGADNLQLSDLALQLDDTKLGGTLGISNFDKPATRFDLVLDAIDLDRYLEPETEAGAAAPEEQGAGTLSAEDIPVETLRDLRLAGRLRAGRLRYAGIDLSDVDAKLLAADGRVRLDPLIARVYGGEYRGTIGIDATAAQARLTLDQQLSALQVGQALQALYQADELTGALSGRLAVKASGNTTEALLKSLAGTVALDLADGAYLGTDLWHEIRSARARLKGEAPPPAPAEPRTPITALQLAGTVTDGVFATERLLADVPFIRVSGAGRLDLVGKAMDYRVRAQVTGTPEFEDGTRLKDLEGLAIPITLAGPLDKPRVGVDLKELATGVATQKLRDRLLKKLGGGENEPAPSEAAPKDGDSAQPTEPPPPEKPRDALKRTLRDLLKPPP